MVYAFIFVKEAEFTFFIRLASILIGNFGFVDGELKVNAVSKLYIVSPLLSNNTPFISIFITIKSEEKLKNTACFPSSTTLPNSRCV